LPLRGQGRALRACVGGSHRGPPPPPPRPNLKLPLHIIESVL
jgi:hypothetical protein